MAWLIWPESADCGAADRLHRNCEGHRRWGGERHPIAKNTRNIQRAVEGFVIHLAAVQQSTKKGKISVEACDVLQCTCAASFTGANRPRVIGLRSINKRHGENGPPKTACATLPEPDDCVQGTACVYVLRLCVDLFDSRFRPNNTHTCLHDMTC